MKPAPIPSPARPLRRAVAMACAGLPAVLASSAALAVSIERLGTEEWLGPDATITLRIDTGAAAESHDWRIFVGTTDVTALVRRTAPDTLELHPSGLAWPVGATELVVWHVDGRNWAERARLPLKVLTAGGFESSELKPTLDLQTKGRGGESGAPASARGTFVDEVMQAGVEWKGARGGWTFDTTAQISGTTFRGEALRFGVEGNDAPKVDLGSYRVGAAHGRWGAELGHVTAGTHPLLASSWATRGIGVRAPLGANADIALHAMNGNAIVGWNNPFGLEDADNRVYIVAAGAELLPDRPGGLRAEVTLLDGSVLSRADFNAGQVPDAEESRGLGLRVLGNFAEGRLRFDAAVSRSRFVNPYDPQLALNGELRPVQPATRNAWRADVQGDVLKQSAALSERHPLDVTLSWYYDRAAPQYKSLGVSLDSDVELNRLGLRAAMAGAQLQLLAARKEDNLDDIPTLLTTRTDTLGAALELPLPAWAGGDKPASGWPTASLNWQTVRQQGINEPPTDRSGFAPTHRPDQRNDTLQLNLAWAFERGTLAWGITGNRQDNRQPGRENADFESLSTQLSASWTFSESLRATAGLNFGRQDNLETDVAQTTYGAQLGVDWQIDENWSLSGQLDVRHGGDSRDLSLTRGNLIQLQLARRFALPLFGREMPSQVFVRAAHQDDFSENRVFSQSLDQRLWWVDFGISFKVF